MLVMLLGRDSDDAGAVLDKRRRRVHLHRRPQLVLRRRRLMRRRRLRPPRPVDVLHLLRGVVTQRGVDVDLLGGVVHIQRSPRDIRKVN